MCMGKTNDKNNFLHVGTIKSSTSLLITAQLSNTMFQRVLRTCVDVDPTKSL